MKGDFIMDDNIINLKKLDSTNKIAPYMHTCVIETKSANPNKYLKTKIQLYLLVHNHLINLCRIYTQK